MSVLSVVVASQNAGQAVMECLASLDQQRRRHDVEIIVVENSRVEVAQEIRARFPSVRVLREEKPQLVPLLWAKGAAQASGAIIAFTIGDCIPDPEWISAMLNHHREDHAGVGGALENRAPATLAQWAIYFCRYAAYMPPFAEHPAAQIPGDNAAYKRWVLERYASLIEGGFWESMINARLRSEGHSLLLSPRPRVSFAGSTPILEFCRQRIAHGRIFGAARARSVSLPRRAFLPLLSPLVPGVFLAKILRHVLGKRRHLRQFVQAFPLLALFVLCWSWGEFLGYLLGSPSQWLRRIETRLPETRPLGSR